MCCWRRGDRVEFWRESVGVLVVPWWADPPEFTDSSLRALRPRELRAVRPGETRPSCESCWWAKAKSAGCCDDRRAISELPRVMSVIGGPREVSIPCPLNEAGGRRDAGDRASLPDDAGCGEK